MRQGALLVPQTGAAPAAGGEEAGQPLRSLGNKAQAELPPGAAHAVRRQGGSLPLGGGRQQGNDATAGPGDHALRGVLGFQNGHRLGGKADGCLSLLCMGTPPAAGFPLFIVSPRGTSSRQAASPRRNRLRGGLGRNRRGLYWK